MRRFGWGWLKGGAPATQITINFVVDIRDMIGVLAGHASNYFFDTETDVLASTPTVHQVEQVIRRHYAWHGEGDFSAGEDLRLSDYRQCREWAEQTVARVFPEQFTKAKKAGLL